MRKKYSSEKPKDFTRKGTTCSCKVGVWIKKNNDNIKLEEITIKYKVIPSKDKYYHPPYPTKKGYWSTWQYWGTFDNVIELPEHLRNLTLDIHNESGTLWKIKEPDAEVHIAHFERGNKQMAFVLYILIVNEAKYNIGLRKIKLKKLGK